MELFSEGKITNDGTIFSNDTITEKEGYDAMLLMLQAFYEASGSNDLTDILSGGEYWLPDKPADPGIWEYWLEAVDKVRKGGTLPLKELH